MVLYTYTYVRMSISQQFKRSCSAIYTQYCKYIYKKKILTKDMQGKRRQCCTVNLK